MIAGEYINKHTDGTVGLVAPLHDIKLVPGVPQLSSLLQVDEDKAKLPGIYFFHGKAGEVSVFDYPYEKFEVSPDLLVIWSRRELIKSDIVGQAGFLK